MKSPRPPTPYCLLAVLLACMASLTASRAAAQEHLYPHAERQSGPWGYIDKTGRIVIPLQYQQAQPFSEGLAAVRTASKFGFIDRTGRVVIDFQFGWVQPFQDGRSVVSTGRVGGRTTWAITDPDGRITAVPNAQSIRPFSEGRAVITISDIGNKQKAGVIDPSGRLVIEPEYDQILSFSEGLAAARRNGKWGFIDKDGAVVIPFEYSFVSSFSEGRAKVQKFGSQITAGFIDRSGRLVIALDFIDANEFRDGLATIRIRAAAQGSGWCVIDDTGKLVIPPQFAQVGYYDARQLKRGVFSAGLLAVSDGRNFGYVDRQGVYVIQPRFAGAFAFQHGLAVVHVRSEAAFGVPGAQQTYAGAIDRSGQFLVRPVFDGLKIHPGGLIEVWYGARRGYLDAGGRPLTLSEKDIDDYVARKTEELKVSTAREREALERLHGPRPPPGRAVVGKAGSTEYYLRLPESLCALDVDVPRDRKVIEQLKAKAAAELEAAKKTMPQASEQTLRTIKEANKLPTDNVGSILKCDQLEKSRSSGDERVIRTVAVAVGMQKDHYDRSAGAGLVFISALMCQMLDKNTAGPRQQKDHGVRVWAAFKRLEAGETTQLLALAFENLASYSAGVMPATGESDDPAQAPRKAKVRFFTMAVFPDWLVQIGTEAVIPASPDALFQELEHEKALVRAITEANLKKEPPSKRP